MYAIIGLDYQYKYTPKDSYSHRRQIMVCDAKDDESIYKLYSFTWIEGFQRWCYLGETHMLGHCAGCDKKTSDLVVLDEKENAEMLQLIVERKKRLKEKYT